ncbi:MAG: HEAT repeat domain-containing protein [Planctomycetia bacterium]|nr:HEAT repeat domain-containing protein [Planctomycetia bacterium]
MACELTCIYCKQRLTIKRPRPGQLIRCTGCARVVPVPWAASASPPPVAPTPAPSAPALAWYQVVNLRLLSLSAAAALTAVGGLVAGAAWRARPAPTVAVAALPAAPVRTLIETEARPLDAPLAGAPLDRQSLLSPLAEALPVEEPVAEVRPDPTAQQFFKPHNIDIPCAVGELNRFIRRQQQGEAGLNRQLLDMPQLRLEPLTNPANRVSVASQPSTTTQIFQASRVMREWSGTAHVVPAALGLRPDLRGLPFVMGKDCQLESADAQRMEQLSRHMRGLLAHSLDRSGQVDAEMLKRAMVGGKEMQLDIGNAGAIPCLMQMLQLENPGVRTMLIEQLARIEQPKASESLAKLALFDLSPEMRERAIRALATRPRAEVRPLLLAGLRYPWAPVADHAAEALVALQDKEAVPALKQLSDAVDPNVATYDLQSRTWMTPEVVRINHLSNCVMCHAPSHSSNDLVRGQLPSQNEPLPPPTEYYSNGTGPFVRADITYLRQDFSVMQEVDKPGKWPKMQRFDYLVRRRPEKPEEAYHRVQRTAAGNYPQRQAVLFALRELSK